MSCTGTNEKSFHIIWQKYSCGWWFGWRCASNVVGSVHRILVSYRGLSNVSGELVDWGVCDIFYHIFWLTIWFLKLFLHFFWSQEHLYLLLLWTMWLQ
jgi:hypothetical protein